MKKLNNKQLKNIKAGAKSGAFLNGIANIAKVVVNGFLDLGNSIAGWVMGFKEMGKGHAKMNLKIGNVQMSYDDTQVLKTNEHISIEQIKASRLVTASPKHTKLALEPLPELTDLSINHDVQVHDMYNVDADMSDGFMHF